MQARERVGAAGHVHRGARRAAWAVAALWLGGAAPAHAFTFVLDFVQVDEPAADFRGEAVEPLFPGLGPADYDLVLEEVRGLYTGIPGADADPRSPIPAGLELDVDFERGEVGTPPANGDSRYAYALIGSSSLRGTSGLGLLDVLTSAVGSVTSATWIATPAWFDFAAEIVAHEIAHNAGVDHVTAAAVSTPGGEEPLMVAVLDGGAPHAFSFESAAGLVAAFGLRPRRVAEPPGQALTALGLLAVLAARGAPRRRRAGCPARTG